MTNAGYSYFPQNFVERCRSNGGMSFAVALSRLTRWPIEGLTLSNGRSKDTAVEFWCIDDQSKWVMQATAISKFDEHLHRIQTSKSTHSLLNHYSASNLSVTTFSESALSSGQVALLDEWDEEFVLECEATIRAAENYLAALPTRPQPAMPPEYIGEFSYGNCAIYAEALAVTTNLPATGITFTKFEEHVESSSADGYHSVILHPDGQAEDIWGKCDLSRICRRYFATEYKLSGELHKEWIRKSETTDPAGHAKLLAKALSIIDLYRTTSLPEST